MKIVQKITIFILLFFLMFCIYPKTYIVYAKNCNPYIELSIDNKSYFINNNKNKELNLTQYQKREIDNYKLKLKQINILKNNGFNSEEIVKYLYPFLYNKTIEIIKREEISPENAEILICENSAKIKLKNEKNGIKLNKKLIFDKILYNLQNKNTIININKEIDYPEICITDIEKYSYLKSSYKTNFRNSNDERKSNIKLAMKALDGYTIFPGEIFSFNTVVGERTEERGYKQAKIIANGKFVESFGGGVCQVSTTLYNSALLAGLEIKEVHSHSLKIGYIEPGFDAMVNGKICDLKFKNNTKYPLTITTSSIDDICNISIYGVKNELIYKRIFNYESIIDNNIIDKNKIIQPASKVKTSLLIYKDDELVDEKILREVYYKPFIIDE